MTAGKASLEGAERRSTTWPIRAESVVVGFVRIFPIDPGTGDNFEGPLGMVKDEHGVAKDEVGFGKAEWIGLTSGSFSKWRGPCRS